MESGEDSYERKKLNLFGQILMTDVRDNTIDQWEGYIDGSNKGITAQEVFKQCQHFNLEDKELIKKLFSQVVDTTIHHLLVAVEQNENLNVTISLDSIESINIKDISDGLAGELYTEDGWIATFSENDDHSII